MSGVKGFPQAGSNVDIAAFGEIVYWTGDDPMEIEKHPIEVRSGLIMPVETPGMSGKHFGLEWNEPRQIHRLVIHFDEGSALPDPASVKVQYRQHTWPARWNGGWTHIDDPYHGRWLTAHGEFIVDGATWTYEFDPLDIAEHEGAGNFAVTYRQSSKLRLLFKGDVAPVRQVCVYSDSIWRETSLRLQYINSARSYSGEVSVYNGYLLEKTAREDGIEMNVLYADCESQVDPYLLPVPPDRTIVTLHASPIGASFAPSECINSPIYSPDTGLFISSDSTTVEDYIAKDMPGKVASIYDRVTVEPEQSYARARREIPHLVKSRQTEFGRYVCLGADSNRQEFALLYNGDIFVDKTQLKVSGRDTARLLWPGHKISYRFATGSPVDFHLREDAVEQSAADGYLPIFTSRWKDREIEFQKTDFAAYLDQTPWNEEAKRGDEPLVALSRIAIRNTTEDPLTASLWLVIEEPEELEVQDGFVSAVASIISRDVRNPEGAMEKRWVVQPYKQKRLRAYFDARGRGRLEAARCSYEPYSVANSHNAVAYTIDLAAGETHYIEVKIPFITFLDGDSHDLVAGCDFDAKYEEMKSYWQQLLASGGDVDTPEDVFNRFVKSVVLHVAITGDKVVETGDYMLPAATYRYDVCANEACHQIRAIDYLGHHERARNYLMPYVKYQGSRRLHGRFRSQEGVLHGLKVSDEVDYQTFNYNLDHGFVLFALCEHYLFTGDTAWAKSIAENLIAACDFVTRERAQTMVLAADGSMPANYGLVPAGHLEDNPEWLHWFAVNSYCYRGMAAAALVLEEIGHADAGRISNDAQQYRTDLRRSIFNAMMAAPMVRLSDGTFIPFVPTRAGLRGRDIGWIRDALYGPLHAVECGVLDPEEDISKWILQDHEDNVLVSRYRGRQIDRERFWFSQGGNTIQSGLMPIALVYVKRNQPEHAIRCLYNSFAQNIYEDVMCFTEHPVEAFGLGAGPFYKTPDESCWVNWLRNVLLTEVQRDKLVIAPAAPRAWFADGQKIAVRDMASYFGPLSYEINSSANSGEIRVHVDAPSRRAVPEMDIVLRHPERLTPSKVLVNGVETESVSGEVIRIPNPSGSIEITARY